MTRRPSNRRGRRFDRARSRRLPDRIRLTSALQRTSARRLLICLTFPAWAEATELGTLGHHTGRGEMDRVRSPRRLGMRRNAVILLATFLAGCASVQPYRVSKPAPTSTPESIFSCAASLVTSFGYTMEQANKDAAFFKAERSERKGASSIHWGATLNEELTIFVLSVSGQPPTLQVTAASNYSGGRNTRLVDPSELSRAEADKIIAACAK
jgi:hypothetical protein